MLSKSQTLQKTTSISSFIVLHALVAHLHAQTQSALIESLQNSAFSASSEYCCNGNGEPYAGVTWRAYYSRYSQIGWSADTSSTSPTNQYLDIDLGRAVKIYSIASKGVYATYTYNEYVTSYQFLYSLSSPSTLQYYNNAEILSANFNKDTEVKHTLNTPIIARYIRFRPRTANEWIVMRVEVYGHDYVATNDPTLFPTSFPTVSPTSFPTISPSSFPTVSPSSFPSTFPSANPTQPAPTSVIATYDPTSIPSTHPIVSQTQSPSQRPTNIPTSIADISSTMSSLSQTNRGDTNGNNDTNGDGQDDDAAKTITVPLSMEIIIALTVSAILVLLVVMISCICICCICKGSKSKKQIKQQAVRMPKAVQSQSMPTSTGTAAAHRRTDQQAVSGKHAQALVPMVYGAGAAQRFQIASAQASAMNFYGSGWQWNQPIVHVPPAPTQHLTRREDSWSDDEEEVEHGKTTGGMDERREGE